MTQAAARAAEKDSGVRLSELVAAISLAADLGIGQPMDHIVRSCDLAVRFADQLGVDDTTREATYWVTLLVTAGCTGVSYEVAKSFGDDIAWRAGFQEMGPSPLSQLRYFLGRAGSDRGGLDRMRIRADLLRSGMRAVEESLVAHCRLSGMLSDGVGLGTNVTEALHQTFARWDGKGIPRGLGGDDVALAMRICQIVITAESHHRIAGVDAAITGIRALRGSWLDPHLCDAWETVAADVLAAMDSESSWDAVIAGEPGRRPTLTEVQLDEALEVLADYADLKSPWFSGHSRGVADLAATAARHAGLPENDVTAVRRAALLHDIGRNGIPNTIWDKPAGLTGAERERVQLHAYYTDRIVRRAGGLAPLATIASAAHERVEGSGYPRGIAGDTIPRLGRLLEAADAYHAMLEPRPHRDALTKQDAARELREMARAGQLSGDAVDAVLAAAGHPRRSKPTAPAGLTPRELEVLTLVARGRTLRDVGDALGISPKTAGNHVERIYAKIGVSTRAEATMFAMQHRLLDAL